MKKWLIGFFVWVLMFSFSACKKAPSVQGRIEETVREFGGRLLKVSLLVPKDVLLESMEENYGDFVTPELLDKWCNDPKDAPGRWVSSPWPERIDVVSVESTPDGGFLVQGEIVYVAGSREMPERTPITLWVRAEGEKIIIYDVLLEVFEPEILYENKEYGFIFHLPETWDGFTVFEEKWEGISSGNATETGSLFIIRHPLWKEEEMRQDIPVMVFSLEQWDALLGEEFSVGAAPVGPKELNRNDDYVFALPARYNYGFLEGYEEVESILARDPLKITAMP